MNHNISVRQYASGAELVCFDCDEVVHRMGNFVTTLSELQASAERHVQEHS